MQDWLPWAVFVPGMFVAQSTTFPDSSMKPAIASLLINKNTAL